MMMDVFDKKLIFNWEPYTYQLNKTGVVLISNKLFRFIKTNNTGYRIMRMLDGNSTVADIAVRLSEDYGLPFDIIQAYVVTFIEKLLDQALICTHSSDSIDNEIAGNMEHKIERIYIDITGSCNLGCCYCFKPNNRNSEINTFELSNILRDLSDEISSSVSIFLTGGEPLLHSELSTILSMLKSIDQTKVMMFSNGVLLSKEKVAEFQQYVDTIFLSIAHSEKAKNDKIMGNGHYDNFLRAVSLCKDAGIAVYLSTVPTNDNLHDMISLQSFAHKLKLKGIYIQSPIPVRTDGCDITSHFSYNDDEYNNVVSELRKENAVLNSWRNNLSKNEKFHLTFEDDNCLNLKKLRKRLHCGIGINEISIDINGNIYPCHKLCSDNFLIGSVKQYKKRKLTYYDNNLTNNLCKECVC